jgi:hypothetical protein
VDSSSPESRERDPSDEAALHASSDSQPGQKEVGADAA